MMNPQAKLSDLALTFDYRSDQSDLAHELFIPLLERSTTYDRAAGYFTSGSLTLVSRGLDAFVRNGGNMRLVTSPALQTEDIDAIHEGYAARADVLERVLLEEINGWKIDDELDRISLLSWLIAENRLEVMIALPTGGSVGIYHEKIGVFGDGTSYVALSGSANETRGGLLDNFEVVDVFTSDRDPDRVALKRNQFERLWSNSTESLEVVPFPDAARRALLNRAEPSRSMVALRHGKASRPLRDYQQEALDAWEENDRVGILEMATGTGKTRTAITAMNRLSESTDRLVVVVLAPYIHLVDQWVEEMSKWGIRALPMHGDSTRWLPKALDTIKHAAAGVTDVAVLVATHKSTVLNPFSQVAASLPLASTLLIADEMHHLGTPAFLDSLPAPRYRLGLSATPYRWNDEAGTTRLLDFFGGVIYEYGLRAAISDGYLTPYRYEPVIVELDADELAAYRSVVAQIIDSLDSSTAVRDDRKLSRLMKRRSEILNTASGKLTHLKGQMVEQEPARTLIYCAGLEQLGAVQNIAWDLGVNSRRFSSEESSGDRATMLEGFETGDIPCLAAIRCLDEGVDVPSTREAYLLASSGNPRQFIQRRGRVLRLADGKREARIVDYVVVPEPEHPREEEILRKEIARVVEFAETATNRAQALEPLADYLVRYGLRTNEDAQ